MPGTSASELNFRGARIIDEPSGPIDDRCGARFAMSRRTRNIFIVFVAVVALLCAGIWFFAHLGRGIRVGTGLVSQTLCSGVFVSGVDPDQLYAEAIKPIPGQTRLAKRLHYEIDRKNRKVVGAGAGGFESRSVYHDEFGCTLIRGAEPAFSGFSEPSGGKRDAAARPEIAGPIEIDPPSPKVETAID